MLKSVRNVSKEHILVLRSDQESSIILNQEREIINNLTFLSFRLKNSKRVIAIDIKVDLDE